MYTGCHLWLPVTDDVSYPASPLIWSPASHTEDRLGRVGEQGWRFRGRQMSSLCHGDAVTLWVSSSSWVSSSWHIAVGGSGTSGWCLCPHQSSMLNHLRQIKQVQWIYEWRFDRRSLRHQSSRYSLSNIFAPLTGPLGCLAKSDLTLQWQRHSVAVRTLKLQTLSGFLDRQDDTSGWLEPCSGTTPLNSSSTETGLAGEAKECYHKKSLGLVATKEKSPSRWS